MPPTVISIDHHSPSNSSSESDSFTDGGSSTDDTWDPIYSEDIEPSESASRSRAGPRYRTSSQSAPSIRRDHSRRQATSDHSSRQQRSRSHRPAPNPPSSVASLEDYPGYGRGYPPQHPQYGGRAPLPGYPQSFASGYNAPAPFAGASGPVVPFGPPGSHGYPQNPFSPSATAGAHNYFPPGQPYPPGPPPSGYGGHEIMPYGQTAPYGGYPPYGGMPHPGPGTSGSQSPYYPYSMPVAPPPAESPAPAPAPEPAAPPPPPAPAVDPEVERKMAELEQQLQESRKAYNDKIAAEQKAIEDAERAAATNKKVAEEVAKLKVQMEQEARAKAAADAKAKEAAEQKAIEDAERAAATNKRVAEEVAKVKAQLEQEAKAKETADAKAKFEAEVAAAAKAKADEEQAKAEAEAKEKYEAGVKAKYEEEIKAAKAEADAAKAEADATKALMAPPKEEKKKPIKFKDAVGRKFSFPFHLCQTWAGMEELIRQAFLHVDIIGPHVQDGHYDLIGPNGEIILPQVWETMIEPDWAVTMHMWPMPEPPKPEEAPPPPPPEPPAPVIVTGKHRKSAAKNRDKPPPPPPNWIGPQAGAAGGLPPGIVVVEESAPKKKKVEKPTWSGFFVGGASKNSKSGKGRAKKT